MTPTALVIAALILVLGVGLVAWAWFTMDQVEEGLRSLGGFERKHFEIGPWGAEYAKGTN
jgi:hypothetical protein